MDYSSPKLQAEARDIASDVLKTLSVIGVILIHVGSMGLTTLRVDSFNWVSSAFWGSLIRFAVPVFFMCSGALMLNPNKPLPIKRLFSRHFLRILITLLFWGLIYEYFFIAGKYILYRTFDPWEFLRAVGRVLSFEHHFHLYYLQIILIVYACLPITRTFVAHASRSTLRYAIGLWFVLGILFPFLWKFEPFSGITGIPGQFPLSMTYSAIGYGLLGWYLRSADIRRKHLLPCIGIFLIGFAIVFGGTVAYSFHTGVYQGEFLEGMSPGVCILAVGIFSTVTAACDGKERLPWAEKTANASFCIYLIHHFFVMFFITYQFDVYQFPCILSIPTISLVTLICSWIGYLVLSHIPVIKDHLI